MSEGAAETRSTYMREHRPVVLIYKLSKVVQLKGTLTHSPRLRLLWYWFIVAEGTDFCIRKFCKRSAAEAFCERHRLPCSIDPAYVSIEHGRRWSVCLCSSDAKIKEFYTYESARSFCDLHGLIVKYDRNHYR